tara:strand:+ start:127 stop:1194 length:1068 start_codon:yes stop_codon:yes gene_type:complete
MNHVGSGNWIGSGGLLDKGIRDIAFMANDSTMAALVHRTSKISFNRRDVKIEFGLSSRMTFSLHVPSYSSFSEEIGSSKDKEVDSLTTNLDSLLAFYYPENKSSTGLGDATLAMNILLFGFPSWSGKEPFSVYAGLGIRLPSGKRLGPYRANAKDKSGIPNQFNELPIGNGLARYSLSLFGEFFKYFNERLVNITWRVERAKYSREMVNTPVSFLWGAETDPDSIIAMTGKNYLRQLGDELLLSAMGKLELWPDRVSITGGINSIRTQKDFVYSNDPNWDSWMVSRERNWEIVHDTRKTQIRQYLLFTLHNVHPTKSIGPVQFDIEFGASFPYFTRHTYSFSSAWVGIRAYFQEW